MSSPGDRDVVDRALAIFERLRQAQDPVEPVATESEPQPNLDVPAEPGQAETEITTATLVPAVAAMPADEVVPEPEPLAPVASVGNGVTRQWESPPPRP